MTAPADGVVRYDCTRIGLINALRHLPLTRHLHLWALGKLADSVLAVLPEASDAPGGRDGTFRHAAGLDLEVAGDD